MSFKQLIEQDMSVMYNSSEFGERSLLIPSEGDSYPVDGIFDESEQSVDVGINVVSTNPIFSVPEIWIRGTLSKNDKFVIENKTYLVRDFEPDGAGSIDIMLALDEE